MSWLVIGPTLVDYGREQDWSFHDAARFARFVWPYVEGSRKPHLTTKGRWG
jgi:hypothetical protein